MIEIVDECVGCSPHMGCLGSACRYRNVRYYYCDECGDDLDPDNMFGDESKDTGHYCIDCARKLFPEDFEDEDDN